MDKINQNKKKLKVKPVSLKKENEVKVKKFDEKYKRFTTYLKPEFYKQIKNLKKKGRIRTLTEFINAAVEDYMENNF